VVAELDDLTSVAGSGLNWRYHSCTIRGRVTSISAASWFTFGDPSHIAFSSRRRHPLTGAHMDRPASRSSIGLLVLWSSIGILREFSHILLGRPRTRELRVEEVARAILSNRKASMKSRTSTSGRRRRSQCSQPARRIPDMHSRRNTSTSSLPSSKLLLKNLELSTLRWQLERAVSRQHPATHAGAGQK